MPRLQPLTLASLAGALLALLLASMSWGQALELLTLNARVRLRPPPGAPSPVTMVVLRGEQQIAVDTTLRDTLADLMGTLETAPPGSRPRALVVDVLLSAPEPGDGTSTRRILSATRSLGRVVHAFQLAFYADSPRQPDADVSSLDRHRLNASGGNLSLRGAPGLLLAHPRMVGELYGRAAGVGYTNLSPRLELGQESISYTLPLLAQPLLQATGSGREVGDEGKASGPVVALSLAGAATALCDGADIARCIRLEGGELVLMGTPTRTVPLDSAGELWINYHRRFDLTPPEPDPAAAVNTHGLPLETAARPLLEGALPEVIVFHAADGGGGWFSTLDGRSQIALEQLGGQVLLAIDAREPRFITGPFGRPFHPAMLHAHAMANLLEADFLRRFPPGGAPVSAMVLVGLALAWRRKKLGATAQISATLPVSGRTTDSVRSFLQGLHRAFTAPELVLGALWALGSIVLFNLWSLWLPLIIPLLCLLGAWAGRQLSQRRLVAREGEAIQALVQERQRLLDALAVQTAALGEARAWIDDAREDQARADSSGEASEGGDPTAALALSAGELRAIDAAFEEAFTALGERLPAIGRDSGEHGAGTETGERMKARGEEIRHLLRELASVRGRLDRRAHTVSELRDWLSSRRTTYQRLLENAREAMEESIAQAARLEPVFDSAQSAPAFALPDPEILAKTGCLTADPALITTLEEVLRGAASPLSVLILGESGTGKDLVASAFHRNSPRRERRFVALNCAVPNVNLLESELFGHVKGAFSGATRDRPGVFREADGGTLFLDELGEMSLDMQAKLLRTLETGEVIPVGGDLSTGCKVDVRVVAATHADLETRIREGKFRGDLYFRLKRLVIHLPPLRERRGDVPLLARHLLERECAILGRTLELEPAALQVLEAHPWPGNVRELKGVIESLAVLTSGNQIDATMVWRQLRGRGQGESTSETQLFTPDELSQLKLQRHHRFRVRDCAEDPAYPGNRQAADRHLRVFLCRALAATGGAVTEAAALLAGPGHPELNEVLETRLRDFLENLSKRLAEESPEALQSALKRQYRADYPHVARVVEALRNDRLQLNV